MHFPAKKTIPFVLATRTDDGTVKSEKLYCEQAPGFNVKAKDGAPMVCEILVALQGRVDAARHFKG
eukprot:scaffold54351_cov111-Phaeocystis_antarctica.AAC.2